MLVGAPSSRNAASARSAARQRVGEVGRRAVHDHLGQQRIEVGIGAVAGIAVAVDAHARPRRRLEDGERAAAGLGRAVGRHRLHVDAQLDAHAARLGARRGRPWPASCRRPAAAASAPDRRPLTSSVTVCSTCRRGLASMKKNARVAVDQELEGAEAAVVHGLGHARRRRRRSSCAAPASRLGRAPSRRSSGCAAAGCIRARPGATMPPLPSPTICTSMWRARPTSRST